MAFSATLKVLCLVVALLAVCTELNSKRIKLRRKPPTSRGSNELNNNFVPRIGTKCRNRTLCEHVANYPSEHINTVLHQIEQEHPTIIHMKNNQLEKRISLNFTKTKDSACLSTIHMIRPRVAFSEVRGWLFVINNPSNPNKLRVELCKTMNASCSDNDDDSDKSRCIQNYSVAELPTIDRKGKPSVDQFNIPAGCACEVVPVIQPSTFSKFRKLQA